MTSNRRPQNDPELIIFTDLDGTLLNSSYSFDKALPALKLINEKRVPLIICSSKTSAEIEVIRKNLQNHHPFVSENGGGIYIPKNSKCQIANAKYAIEELDKYYLIKIGADYADLRTALAEIRDEGFDVRGFGDMSSGEVAELTGLNESDAELAKIRQFDETFIFEGSEASVEDLKERINSRGFNYTQGEYFHIMGNSDKGRAVEILKMLYKTEDANVITAAFGDSLNDIEMLNNVDRSFLVQKEDGSYNRQVLDEVKGCIKVDGIGPVGWNKAVIELIGDLRIV
ncbi:MAG: HAD-IIB family hydrolase [Nitrospira sp.]|nr:HAD-IIB family hydrolase [Nitrospira sp.]